jgi:hypothetical protein
MKKLMFASFAMACVFAIAGQGQTPAASAAPAAPQIGGCRWFCGSSPKQFTTAKACQASCSSACDEVC